MNPDDFMNELRKILPEDSMEDLEQASHDVELYQGLCAILQEFYISKPLLGNSLNCSDEELSNKFLRIYRKKGLEMSTEELEEYVDFVRTSFKLMELFESNYSNWVEKGKFLDGNRW